MRDSALGDRRVVPAALPFCVTIGRVESQQVVENSLDLGRCDRFSAPGSLLALHTEKVKDLKTKAKDEAPVTATSALETSAPAGSAEPTQEATDAPDAPDADKESDAEDEGETTGPPVPLTPDDEEGVMYLHPVQAFSPLLERWVVDTEGGQLHYTRYTCLGTVDDEGYGSIKAMDGDRWEVTWEGESPMRLSSGQTTSVEITDTTLTSHPDVASTNTDMEVRKYVGMCTKAGKGVADFVLG